jgi:RNA polymerase sigma-70 factor (ECF subfamily)
LLTITRNQAIDHIRVRRRSVVDPDELLASVVPAAGPGPEEAAEVMEEVARLRVALAALPLDQRRAIVLAGVLGLSGREVAEVEEIPLGTAKTRIRGAMLRLRAALGHEERAE